MEAEKKKQPSEWFISGNPKKYDVIGAFRKLGKIEWKQSTNVFKDDIVYIYLSNTIQKVQFKCRANKVNIQTPTIEDSEFNYFDESEGDYGRYMELEMIKELHGSAFCREKLGEHGFSSPQSPVRVPVEVKAYMDLVQDLQNLEELDPDKYDGSYELLRETIGAYAEMESLESCDYRDLNLLYLMTVDTGKHGLSKKKKTVEQSHLRVDAKKKLIGLLDSIWDRSKQNQYMNNSEGFGMFGTGFYSFQGKTDKVSPRRFIETCIDIINITDDNAIFDRVEKVLNKDFSGMRAASASMVLHCLKPFTFPIFNGNMGSLNIYAYFGIPLKKKDQVDTYIDNCRSVKAYRDDNFSVKNYRIFDMAAWNLSDMKKGIKTDFQNGDSKGMKENTSRSDFDRNLILYGPPGTGKTYSAAYYAVAICDEKSIEDIKDDFAEVMTRYNELKISGRIAFTTFHQSYGYEEFIEGIKPVFASENEGGVKGKVEYEIVDGIFKSFCSMAEKAEVKMDQVDIPKDAIVWKVTVREVVRNDCFTNNRVRIDWDMDGEGAYGFVNDMKKGDIVITTGGSRNMINGIAVITSEEAESLKTESDKTSRTVSWLAKDTCEEIKSINNDKILHRMTVARVPGMKISDVVSLAMKNNPRLSNTEIEENKKPYVFIIDEINRGNISKIFGELITLIEESKRKGMNEAASATLPYSRDPFEVPENVYILGTMNTADRSIALMDTALRRRFGFIEMIPDTEVLRNIGAGKVGELDVAEMLDTINKRISFLYDREHTIGHGFFTGLKDDPTVEKLGSIFEKSIIPLLQEYFYEDYEKIQLVLGDNGKTDESYKFILDEKIRVKEVFKGSPEDTIDLPEKKYTLNKGALYNLRSYLEIV